MAGARRSNQERRTAPSQSTSLGRAWKRARVAVRSSLARGFVFVQTRRQIFTKYMAQAKTVGIMSLVILGTLLLGTTFWWFQLRPFSDHRACAKYTTTQAEKMDFDLHTPIYFPGYGVVYDMCLHGKGY